MVDDLVDLKQAVLTPCHQQVLPLVDINTILRLAMLGFKKLAIGVVYSELSVKAETRNNEPLPEDGNLVLEIDIHQMDFIYIN